MENGSLKNAMVHKLWHVTMQSEVQCIERSVLSPHRHTLIVTL